MVNRRCYRHCTNQTNKDGLAPLVPSSTSPMTPAVPCALHPGSVDTVHFPTTAKCHTASFVLSICMEAYHNHLRKHNFPNYHVSIRVCDPLTTLDWCASPTPLSNSKAASPSLSKRQKRKLRGIRRQQARQQISAQSGTVLPTTL